MIDVVPLCLGATFKKAFSRLEVFRQFVHDVLDISIDIEKVEQEYTYPERIGQVKSAYDLFAEDKKQRIIIEIQHVKEGYFFDRFLYYHLISMVEQPKSYKAYYINKTVYSIVVLTAEPEDETMNFSMAVSDMDALIQDQDRFNEKLGIYNHRLVFLNPVAVSENTPKSVKPWLELIKESLHETIDETHYKQFPIFKEILDDISRDNVSPEQLEELLAEAEWQKVKNNSLERGIEKGAQKEKLQIAKSMLQKKLDISLIAEITGLTQEDITKLKSGL